MSKPFPLEGYHKEYIEAVEDEAKDRVRHYYAKGKIVKDGSGGLTTNPNWPNQPVKLRARTPNVMATIENGCHFIPHKVRPEQLR